MPLLKCKPYLLMPPIPTTSRPRPKCAIVNMTMFLNGPEKLKPIRPRPLCECDHVP